MPNDDLARIIEDTNRIRSAIADAIQGWANVEASLSLLLDGILAKDKPYGLVVYFIPVATELRFSIVDAVVKCFLLNHPAQLLNPVWAKIFKHLNSGKRVRNKIAHGNICTANVHGKNHARLTPPIFSSVAESITSGGFNPHQLPGMSPHDVEAAAKHFGRCTNHIYTFIDILRDWSLPDQNEEALRDRLTLLAKELNVA